MWWNYTTAETDCATASDTGFIVSAVMSRRHGIFIIKRRVIRQGLGVHSSPSHKTMYQSMLLEQYLDPIRLKEGKDQCPCCGKLMRSYCKTMDQRLISQAWEILLWMREKRARTFYPRAVFNENHQKLCDYNKLHYWGVIEKSDKGTSWKLTGKGYDFLMGRIQLPKELWVFNNRIVDESDEMVTVENADPRWQEGRSDWTFDYIPYKYNNEPKL